MKTDQEKIVRNRIFVIIAMAVVAVVMFGTLLFQHSKTSESKSAPISQNQEFQEETNSFLQKSVTEDSITVKGKISSLTFAE